MNSALSVGSTLVLMPRFEAAAALALMGREEITVFAGVPTMYWALLGALEGSSADADVDTIARNMRKAISGGAALPVEIPTQFKTKFGVQILEGYGLSETSPLALFSDPERPDDPARPSRAAGRVRLSRRLPRRGLSLPGGAGHQPQRRRGHLTDDAPDPAGAEDDRVTEVFDCRIRFCRVAVGDVRRPQRVPGYRRPRRSACQCSLPACSDTHAAI